MFVSMFSRVFSAEAESTKSEQGPSVLRALMPIFVSKRQLMKGQTQSVKKMNGFCVIF